MEQKDATPCDGETVRHRARSRISEKLYFEFRNFGIVYIAIYGFEEETVAENNHRSNDKANPTNFAHMRESEHKEFGEFVCF